MTDPGSTPDNPIDNDTPWVADQIRQYLATDGREPQFPGGSPLGLLTTKGRTSGEWRRTCLIVGEYDGEYLVVASLGGAPKHPAWYLNLQENPTVRLQVGADVFDGTARTATADEKPPLWDRMVELYPTYTEYQEKTDRDIPVVVIARD